MKRLSIVAAIASLVAAVALVPGAIAHSNNRAHVYRANLRPVPVGDYGLLAHAHGHAQLVDGKKRNKLSIHVRGLAPGVTYAWHIHQAPAGVDKPCNAPSATAPSVDGWTYKALKANAAGNGNSKAKSTTFNADPDATYYVDVHTPSGLAFLCGVLNTKKHKPHPPHPAKGHGKNHSGTGKGHKH
jgi:hypothetical protein